MTDQAAPTQPDADPAYYAQGQRWEVDVYRRQRRSAAFAWILALIFGGIAIAAITALILLVPLKEFEPYVVVVDRTTGYTEISRALREDGSVTHRQAVIESSVVRYVLSRETYDPDSVRENFELAALLSTGDAARELAAQHSSTSPTNPTTRYGRNTKVSVVIKSITFPNSRTALVRFQTATDNRSQVLTHHFVSLVRFQTTNAPMRNEWRWQNPIGFQVTEYRRDQETVAPQVEDRQG